MLTQNGLFNALLGPIDASVFDGSDRWMEIEVEGEILGARQRIVSVAYAIRATSAADADTLGGKPPSEFVTNPLDGNFTVNNGSVLFAGTTGVTPASGAGVRMMWIPEKKAFRAGEVTGTQWDADNVGSWSFAVGYDTKSGHYSTAMGADTTASGEYSTAMGSQASTNGHKGSFVYGDRSTTTVMNATADNQFFEERNR